LTRWHTEIDYAERVLAERRVRSAKGPLVPKGGGYRERDATKSSLDPARAMDFTGRARARSQELMHERELEICAGLEHLTPAALEIKRTRGRLEH